jgi:hypothetical protein
LKAAFSYLGLTTVFLLSPASSSAQDVKPGGRETITVRGIVSASFYVQDALFGLGNGQKAQYVSEDTQDDAWWHGGDARSTRLTLGFAGPEVGKSWRANAALELDFFGPFAAGGNFGDEQPLPRLRLAYAELNNGRTVIRVGQDFALTWGNVPVSTSHIGFPFGWGAGGLIGWRFTGVQIHQTITPVDASTSAQLKAGVFKNSWSDEPGAPPPGAVPSADDGPSAGESGTPQLEMRLDVSGKAGDAGTWGLYLVGHYDTKDLDRAGVTTADSASLTSWAAQGGARVVTRRLTLHGNAYYGRAMGHHFAHIIQFRDVKGWGAWAQAGLNVGEHWSVWGFAGTDDPEDVDENGVALERTRSIQLVPMLRLQLGQLFFGAEWLHSRTDWTAAPAERKGNQLIFSTMYNF